MCRSWRDAAVVGDEPCPVRQVGVARHDGAAVAEGAEVFAREKAGASHVAKGAGGALHSGALVHGTEALGVVFNEAQPMLLGPGHEGVHVGALPEEVHHDDGLRAGGSGALGRGGVEVEGVGVDVCEDGGGADFGHDFGRGDEGKVGDDDLVAWADTERAQGEVQGVCAVAAADDVGVELEGGAEFGLEGGHVPPADEGRLLEHLVHGPVELGPESPVQPLQVDHVDGARRRLRTGRVHRQEAKIARTLAA